MNGDENMTTLTALLPYLRDPVIVAAVVYLWNRARKVDELDKRLGLLEDAVLPLEQWRKKRRGG